MSTGIALHLWVSLAPGADPAGSILTVDASRHAPPRHGRVACAALHEDVLTPWQEFEREGTADEIVGRQRVVPASELLDEDVNLSPAAHVPQPSPDVDAAALNHTSAGMSRTRGELPALLPQVATSAREPPPRPPSTISPAQVRSAYASTSASSTSATNRTQPGHRC